MVKIAIGLNNPRRRAIHTPDGIFNSAEEYAKTVNTITSNGLRNYLKNCDKPLTAPALRKSKLFTRYDIGKTPRELGYYYI